MANPRRTLKVMCNPFAALHETEDDVRCAGAFPHEPNIEFGDSEVRYVGARRVVTMIHPGNPQNRLEPTHDRAFEFSPEVQTVNRSEYYRRALLSRELLPADEATHTWAFGGPEGYRHPHDRIAQKSMELKDLMPADYGSLSVTVAPPADEETAKVVAHVDGAETKPQTWEDILKPHKAKHAERIEKAEAEANRLRALESDKHQTA